MVTLKLTLKSKKPSNVYALNGKAYRLQPGSNTLNLEYDDYVSLAKALGFKPVPSKDAEENAKAAESAKDEVKEVAKKEAPKKKEDPVKEPEKPEVPEAVNEEPLAEPVPATEAPAEEPVEDYNDTPAEEHNDEHTEESNDEPVNDTSAESPVEDHADEHAEEPVNEEKDPDYASMSYTELKAKYKEITGTTCKLKKAEVIQFLQEHDSNV